jgi:hypothetical protein
MSPITDIDNIEYLYKEYIRALDPTEYYYATNIFKSWVNWEKFIDDNPSSSLPMEKRIGS